MTKSVLIALLAVILLVVGAASCRHHRWCGRDWQRKQEPALEEKVMGKAYFMVSYAKELGISEDQVKSIREMKAGAKKDMIMREAQIESIGVDIQSALGEDMTDMMKINPLLDRKYELKKENTRALITLYGSLKGLLTPEQKEKMMEMMKKGEGKHCGMKMKRMKKM